MWYQPRQRWLALLAFGLLAAHSAPAMAQAQEEPAAKPAPAQALPGPEPLEKPALAPVLKTTATPREKQPGFNQVSVDATALPRDKGGIWILEFTFKPIRIQTVEVPGKGRRQVYYMWYKLVNRTGEPRLFVPQFTIVTNTGQKLADTAIEQAIPLIQTREGGMPLLSTVDVVGMVPPSTKEKVDDAVYGVAIWDGIDPKADKISVYVSGLSNGFKVEAPKQGTAEPTTKHKTVRIDFFRRGDEFNIDEKEIQLADPPFEWIYW